MVIAPLDKKVIRFGLGTTKRPTFFIWRLWVQGDEAYLTFVPESSPKFSLHSSGCWKIDLDAYRHNLTGPVRLDDNWMLGPVIFFVNVPHAESTAIDGVAELAEKRKKVLWFDHPKDWHLCEFAVFVGEAELPDDALPPPDTEAEDTDFIGPLRLRNGQLIWVRRVTKPFPLEGRDYIYQLKREARGFRRNPSYHGMLLHVAKENKITVIPIARRQPDGEMILDVNL